MKKIQVQDHPERKRVDSLEVFETESRFLKRGYHIQKFMIRLKTLTVKNFMSVGNVTQAINFEGHDLTLVLARCIK